MAIFPLRTKGGRTTRASSSRPRISTSQRSAVCTGTRARPIERSSVGEKLPLVTSPSPTAGTMTFWFERSTTDEIAILRLPCDGPGKPRLEWRGRLVHVVAVEIHAGLETQRIACDH